MRLSIPSAAQSGVQHVLSRNSHFSLQLGHWFGCASESNEYPHLEHFQLGMVTPPWAGPERAGHRMARLQFDPPE
jgi:hypothetical protein